METLIQMEGLTKHKPWVRPCTVVILGYLKNFLIFKNIDILNIFNNVDILNYDTCLNNQ